MRAWLLGLAALGALLGLGVALEEPAPPPPASRPGWATLRPPGQVLVLALQGGTVWAGAREGLYRVDRGQVDLVSLPDGQTPAFVRALRVGPDGTLWIGHAAGVSRWGADGCLTTETPDPVEALLLDDHGRCWVGTRRGLSVLGGPPVLEEPVNALLADGEGAVWAATEEGLARVGPGEVEWFREVLPHRNVVCLLQEPSGDLWAGAGFHDQGGAVRLARGPEGWAVREVLTRADGLAGEKVRSLYRDAAGALWFGSEADGVARRAGGAWQIFTVDDGLGDAEVRDFLLDPGGTLWMATRNGLTRLDPAAVAALEGRHASR